jgi:hypothetical protein
MGTNTDAEAAELKQYDRICKNRFDQLAQGQKSMLALLRGAGNDPGLVGHVSAHAEHITEVRKTLYDKGGMVDTVNGIAQNTEAASAARERTRALVYSIVSKLITVGILALIGLLSALWYERREPPRPPADAGVETSAAERSR